MVLFALAAPAAASAQSGSGLEIFFVPNSTRAMTVAVTTSALQASATSYDFGPVLVGSAAVTNSSLTVTNAGNIASTLALEVSAQATDLGLSPGGQPLNQHWTAAATTSTAAGLDRFVLYAVFQSSKPANAQYADAGHQVLPAAVCASPTRFKGGQTGLRVPANPAEGNKVGLWFNLFAPLQSSNIKGKRFTVTVTVGGCD